MYVHTLRDDWVRCIRCGATLAYEKPVALAPRLLDLARLVSIAYGEAQREMEHCLIPTRMVLSTFRTRKSRDCTIWKTKATLSGFEMYSRDRYGHLFHVPNENLCFQHRGS
jgi:hypothetical protein